jgi:osmotically-inducible protein OsmY
MNACVGEDISPDYSGGIHVSERPTTAGGSCGIALGAKRDSRSYWRDGRCGRGVKAVVEEIEVRLPFDATRTDEDIAAAVIERLAWDASVPSDAVKVKVEGGWVTLNGEVKWQFQRIAAAEDAHRLSGVRGVSNQITIRPVVNASVLNDGITHALHRSWFFDPLTVIVSAEGGTVRLGGTVRTPHERQVAAATAWSAPGVTDVINDIEIAA